MPVKRTYFEDENLVFTLFYGTLTAAELGQHVLEMNTEHQGKTAVDELADCRCLTDVSELTAQATAFAAKLEQGAERIFNSKGAIVVASDAVYGLARAYSAIAMEERVDSRVYRSIDEAIEWLGVGHLWDQIEQLSEDT